MNLDNLSGFCRLCKFSLNRPLREIEEIVIIIRLHQKQCTFPRDKSCGLYNNSNEAVISRTRTEERKRVSSPSPALLQKRLPCHAFLSIMNEV